MDIERRVIEVQGTVQGVGFRPFIYRLAQRLKLSGFVRNRAGSVLIEAEGDPGTLDRFLTDLRAGVPPLASIDRVSQRSIAAQRSRRFTIESSETADSSTIAIAPDIATCPACLSELFDPQNRRHRYPLINCTDCGPRLTIVQGIPYDRSRTTMAGFAMCRACRQEYEDPRNRRFHAQPIACWQCGPRLALHASDGQQVATDDPLADFVGALLQGKIGALKGLGGYHLVCDARREQSVSELRRRKHREARPFAVMVGKLASVQRCCHIDAHEQDLLESRQRPIVLLRKRPSAGDSFAASVAPGNPFLGVMLPYTPLHHLLLHDVGDIPLIMTSGNRSDEPIAYQDDDAFERLHGIADLFLTHDRPIHVRCDDSVTRIVAGTPSPVRRSRGDAPGPVDLPISCSQTAIAVGGQFKGVFAIGRDRQAILSQHLGDLDQWDAFRAFQRDIELYTGLFDSQPEWIVHDLHPDYATTQYARRYAAAHGLRRLAVQHHHAHVASCMADNGLADNVIGVAFDGTGFGTDGSIWGGEFFAGGYEHFIRAAHLRPVRMPGGEKAVTQPWRMAEAHLADAGLPSLVEPHGVPAARRAAIRQLIQSGFNSPLTTSAGRLFDAAAALIGLRQSVAYEGQAAMELEWLATEVDDRASYPFAIDVKPQRAVVTPSLPVAGFQTPANLLIVDTRPLIVAMANDVQQAAPTDVIACRFHNTLVELISRVCGRIRNATGIESVVLSGGVFQNALLLRGVRQQLAEQDYRVYVHQRVPANDGGLSLGQLAIAAATMQCYSAMTSSNEAE